MTSVGVVFAAALATALATGLGALPFAFARHPGKSGLATANALAAGFMVGAGVGLVVEGVKTGIVRTLAGIAAGWVAMGLVDRMTAHHGEPHFGALRGADAARALMIVGVMTAHSMAEGVGIGVSFGSGEAFGFLIAVAIAVHNIPEGLAISLVLVPRGVSVPRAAGWSVFSSLPQPVLAVPAFLFVEAFRSLLPFGLGFAGGAMGWLAVTRLAPEAAEQTARRRVAAVALPAAAAMLLFQLLLTR
ncbi:MAG TPA: ZIP family metal transporter [Gaiellaceae bacterium]|jgi:zinc transporter ZupT|nr:ZIP family metal transporter [Gaiellaceae bacterium]